MTRFRAPATTANLGPGFDVAGAALELWNELELAEGGAAPDETHLGVRAFSLYASPAGWSFRWTDRIPRERGLGSSAAVVALGLVAGAHAAGVEPSVEELLAAGLELEGHADNLAPALAGGVCLTLDGRIVRVADRLPAVPVAVVPETRVRTAESRTALPDTVPRGDAVFTVARAALLGAGLASGDSRLFALGADDRLHEPYRLRHAPHLAEIRAAPPTGAVAATLSGSGPTVVVWCDAGLVDTARVELEARYPGHTILPLTVAETGARVID
jgi:homoserine kinase